MPGREELRRRLYRPGASAADVAAYRAASPVAPSAAPRPRRRRLPVAIGAVVVVVAAALLLLPRPGPPPTPERTMTAIAVRPADRAGFISGMLTGGPAGLSTWLDAHARALPGALAVATRSETIESAGAGSGTVLLRPQTLGPDGGRFTVLLVAIADAHASWSASGADPAGGSRSRSGELESGVPALAGFAYAPGTRPERLRIRLPAGVRWGVAVVFTD